MCALERLTQSKDHYHFRHWICFINHLPWTHPLNKSLSIYQSYQYITKSITLVQINTSKVYTMHTSLFKTSLYTRSLLANPPAALPQIPTLAELKERTAAIPIPIPISHNDKQNTSSVGWSSLPKSLLPSYSNSPPPSYAPASVKSWARLDDGEVHRELTMKGSKAYVRDRKVQLGMSIFRITVK